ncbi:MAG: hypothetical protein WCG07_02440 [Candidatus Taylorbacteria bacterium]
MNSVFYKKPATLESIAQSIDGISTRVESLESIAKSIDTLAVRVGSLESTTKSIVLSVDTLAVRVGSLESNTKSILLSVDTLAVRMESFESKTNARFDILEERIDDLAILTHNEINKVTVRLDEMDAHLVILDGRVSGLQNQIDNISLNYTPRIESNLFDKRIKKLERAYA